MKILALEFSSPQRSVAVVRSGNRPDAFVASEVIETGAGAARTMKLVDDVLRDGGLGREQIEGIVVGTGPGSYTGIRAAIALAQGWSLAREIKLLGISSAEGVAEQARTDGLRGRVHVVIDAQRGEFYVAGYELSPGSRREIEPLRLAPLTELRRLEAAGEVLIGPEVTKWAAGGRIVFPRAAILGRLALDRRDFMAAEKLEPIYLRETAFVKAPPPRFG
jgi:tRNA threonylcarbamoyladenosine biosynthesis protein TsaB